MDKKIGFIGCGNMGSAMLAGIINSKLLEKENIYCSAKTNESKERLKKEFGINVGSNEEVAKECDILILAVKPHFFSEVIGQIKSIVKKDSIIISIAAGVEIKDIEQLFEIKELKVVRAMPNTPALVGEGMTALCPNAYLNDNEIKEVEAIFNSFGKSEILEEKYFDAFISISW